MARGAIDKLPDGIKKDPEAVAETIVNNMRKVIIDERAMNPKYYDTMSELLDALIDERRKEALDYKDYLAKLLERRHRSSARMSPTPTIPAWADNGAKRALIDFGLPRTSTSPSQSTRAVMQSKPRRLGRQPTEGEAGSSERHREVSALGLATTGSTSCLTW